MKERGVINGTHARRSPNDATTIFGATIHHLVFIGDERKKPGFLRGGIRKQYGNNHIRRRGEETTERKSAKIKRLCEGVEYQKGGK